MTRHPAAQFIAVLVLAASVLAVVGCSSGQSTVDGKTVIRYWLWDASQQPGYRQCADDFERANPDIAIQIDQYGFDDYWTQVTASMVAESAPDVFVNHTARFGSFAMLGQALDLTEFLNTSPVDPSQYQPGLTQLWTGPDGKAVYGLPKDWDTEALFYNTEAVKAAGYSQEDLWKLEWNPTDGGSFERFLAAMTIDENGIRGNQPGFDKTRVKTYGLGYKEAGSGYGQVQWSPFALSNNWRYSDTNPWGTSFNYGDDRFIEAISWWRSLITKGYMPSLAQASSGVGTNEALGSGGYATVFEGVWNARAFSELEGADVQVAPTPIGPSGKRASVYNGLADTIWSGTPNREQAWRWVQYLASPACQNVMADTGRIFPAITESSERAAASFQKLGLDPRAFTVHVEENTAVLTPVTQRWARIDTIMKPAMDAVIGFSAEPDSLRDANEQVNELFS